MTMPRHGMDVKNIRGFTLLEMMVVLGIISVLLGIAVISFDGVRKELHLRKPVSEFEQLLIQARQRAQVYEAPQTIRFGKTDISLLDKGSPSRERQGYATIPSPIQVAIKRFGQNQYSSKEGETLQISPGGTCEPAVIRFQDGQSWIEISLDPLSARVSDEFMHIQ